MDRRRFLTTTGAAGAATALAPTVLAQRTDPLPEPGATLREMEVRPDRMTGRETRRLTSGRRFNQTPTYHLHGAWSRDSRALLLATWWPDDRFALLRADVSDGTLTVLATSDSLRRLGSGHELVPNGHGMVQASDWAAVVVGRSLRAVHLYTFEERVLIEDVGEGRRLGHPIGSIDGAHVFVPVMHLRPEPEVNGRPATHLAVDLATGARRVLFQEERFACNHVVPNPTDPDLLLIDRDAPPGFGRGSDGGQTTRVWILNIRTGALTEVRPRDENRFQIHSNWNHRGDRLLYHGRSAEKGFTEKGGHYVGAAGLDGAVVWEDWYPEFEYGHLSPHTQQDVVYTGGLFTWQFISAIHYTERGAAGRPRIELVGRHDTVWRLGQVAHPHLHASPDGRWLSYNRGGADGRSDVYVIRIG